jgi:hypothetical protein
MFASNAANPAPISIFGEPSSDNIYASSFGRDDGKTYFCRRIQVRLWARLVARPADAVNAVAAYSQSAISSTLRGIAAERLGAECPIVLPGQFLARATRMTILNREIKQLRRCSFVRGIVFVEIAIAVAWSRKKDA